MAYKSKFLSLLSIIFVAGCTSYPREANPIYQLEAIDALSFQGKAICINKRGAISGQLHSDNGTKGFYWSKVDGLRTFDVPGYKKVEVVGMNESGVVIGYGINDTSGAEDYFRSFVWNKDEGIMYFDEFCGISRFVPEAINDHNDVLGNSNTYSVVFNLDTNREIFKESYYLADVINNNREVAGSIDNNGLPRACFGRSKENSVETYKGVCVIGKENIATFVTDINDDLKIIGFNRTFKWGTVRQKAFLWSPSVGVCDLGCIDDHYTKVYGSRTIPNAINRQGQVVGWSSRGVVGPLSFYDDGRAFYWDEKRKMKDLNNIVACKADGYCLVEAMDINDKGQIVGWGIKKGKGDRHPFLLIPIGEN